MANRTAAEAVLEGYSFGPDATETAMADARARARSARSVVLVEGISDVIALETLAERRGLDLAGSRVVVVPMGGAQAVSKFLREFGPGGADLRVCGLCDAGEERFVRRALVESGIGDPAGRTEMEALGFFVCVDDLEHELIRASEPVEIEALLDVHGDLVSFRTLQKQAAWRGRPFRDQMHRWLRAGSTRNLRYARLLIESVADIHLPRPLVAVLDVAVQR